MNLPPFPVDEQSLDLLWAAMHPDPEHTEVSSVFATLEMFSQLGGSDVTVFEEQEFEFSIKVMRDPIYSQDDVLIALITEVRRLRRERP